MEYPKFTEKTVEFIESMPFGKILLAVLALFSFAPAVAFVYAGFINGEELGSWQILFIFLPFILFIIAVPELVLIMGRYIFNISFSYFKATDVASKITLFIEDFTNISTNSENPDFNNLVVQAKFFVEEQKPIILDDTHHHRAVWGILITIIFVVLIIYYLEKNEYQSIDIASVFHFVGTILLSFISFLLIYYFIFFLLRLMYSITHSIRKQQLLLTFQKIIELESSVQSLIIRDTANISIGDYLSSLEDITRQIDIVSKLQAQVSVFKNPSFIERHVYPPADITPFFREIGHMVQKLACECLANTQEKSRKYELADISLLRNYK